MEEALGPLHVPQQSRRHKLRFTYDAQLDHHQHPFLSPHAVVATTGGGLNLSLSTHARSGGAYNATPMGPFTGYASILGRSRFLRPAQELLDDFCRGNGDSFENEASKLLEDSGSWFGEDDGGDDISRRCNNPTLMSMLHEVYKRYKLYCQQMHSAVTSFESVAGLGNAAPFICLAIKAMFKHFHCLKNAILDHIRITGKVFSSVGIKKGCSSGSCSEDKCYYQQKQVPDLHFAQHPVWRSQRGFPDRAVAVLRTWLFEHFLHPYPSDSEKLMLAQKTGLSRSQVSNWFTNARVRLWKPMVEEMHALERKAQCSRAVDTQKLMSMSTDHHLSMPPQPCHSYVYRDEDNNCKRSRVDPFPIGEVSKEHCITPYNHLPGNQVIDLSGSHTGGRVSHPSAFGSSQENPAGLSWSTPGQILPFWLAKQ